MSAAVDNRPLIQAELPAYEPPPPWIPQHNRENHPDYNNELSVFLPRAVNLVRPRTMEPLGFNIRGGVDLGCGIYVSKVLPNSDAEIAGIQEGDQILQCNECSFENILHTEAVRVLKNETNINLVMRYFPYGYMKSLDRRKSGERTPACQPDALSYYPNNISPPHIHG